MAISLGAVVSLLRGLIVYAGASRCTIPGLSIEVGHFQTKQQRNTFTLSSFLGPHIASPCIHLCSAEKHAFG
jgi:hypothetical protein